MFSRNKCFLETSTRQSRYPTMTLQTSATMEKSSQSGSCRGSLLVTHNTLKENSHIQQTPSCYLDVKHSRVYMNLTLCFTLTYIFTVFIPCIFDNNSPNICLFTFYFCRLGVCVLCGPQVHAECHHGALLLLLWDWLLRGLRFVGNRFPEGNWLDVITQRLW